MPAQAAAAVCAASSHKLLPVCSLPQGHRKVLALDHHPAFSLRLWNGDDAATPEERKAYYLDHRIHFQADGVAEMPKPMGEALRMYEVSMCNALASPALVRYTCHHVLKITVIADLVQWPSKAH